MRSSILGVLSFLLFSCENIGYKVSEVSLVPSDTLIIDIDENTYFISNIVFQTVENEKEYLYYVNDKFGLNQCLKIDLDTKEVCEHIPLYEEGPNSVHRVAGFGMLDPSTFLVSSHSTHLFMINNRGEVTNKWKLWDEDDFFDNYCIPYVYSTYNDPLLVKDSVWYLPQKQVGYPKKKEDWTRTPIFAYLDLKTGEIGKTKLCYPDLFTEDEIPTEIVYDGGFSFDTDGNNVAVSFHLSDSIYVSNDFEHIHAYCAKSRYLPHLENTPPDIQAPLLEYLRTMDERPEYWHLIYDKYREVYYRFALHENTLPKDHPVMDHANVLKPFSIMILDKNFNIIGETLMPHDVYRYRMWFIGKKGLYISMNNTNNPICNENQLIFQCLELK